MPFLPKGDGNVGEGRSQGVRMQNFREYKPKRVGGRKNRPIRNDNSNNNDGTESPKFVPKRRNFTDVNAVKIKQNGRVKVKRDFKVEPEANKQKKVKKYRGKSQNKIRKEDIKPSVS